MKNKKINQYHIMLISFAVFFIASFIYRDARYKWNDIPYMVIPDVILSIAGVAMLLCATKNKKTIVKIIGALCGFLLPNGLLWGISMGLGSAIDGGKATTISFIVFFAVYAVLWALAFLFKSEADKKASRITAGTSAVIMCAGCVVSALPLGITDTEEKYNARVEAVSIFENNFESAIPQTKIHDIVTEHFTSPLADGKTEKKCIVIGFDGTRPDIISKYSEHKKSAINTLISSGGHAYLGYCGGVQWPAENTQKTSTAPGWCSILTGCWADKHGIDKNYVPKTLEYKSLFLSLIEDNIVDSTKFCVSWNGHFNNDTCTYYPEKQYAEANSINAQYIDATDDNGTFKNVSEDITSADCTDFLFCIFEQCDHAGHQTNFTPENFGYVHAFEKDDEYAYNIIEEIKNRETYDTEDWLIILTTDHGGYLDEHGGATKQERYTFIIANKDLT